MKKLLTVEEKIELLVGKDKWSTSSCNEKIYSFVMSDGPVGLRHPKETGGDDDVICSISYPSIQVLSQTWDPELSRIMGNALANDCIENGVDIILAPGVNLKRNPVCGRNFEYFSEDPLVAGVMAKEYITGVQEKHIGAVLKHYCCNNMEYSRHWISSEVDERTLRELYLRQFEISCEAKPWMVMCSYNLVNGVRMSEHTKLYKLLREKFKFDGVIISDWDAVTDRIASLKAGLDLEMPFNREHLQALNEAYRRNELPMEQLEESSSRIVALAAMCAAEKKLRKVDMTVAEREAVSLRIAEEGLVLLKNENNVLPLRNDAKIFVTGCAGERYYYGGGSAEIKLRSEFVSLTEALIKLTKNATYFESTLYSRGHSCDIGNLKEAVRRARDFEVSLICVGNNNQCESESFDRQYIVLSREETDTIKSIAKSSKKTIVIVYAGSAIDMRDWIDDVDAVIYAGFGGEFVNTALAKVLSGQVNPSGKLTETFPLRLEDVPAMYAYRDAACFVYSEGLNVGYRYFHSFGVPVLFPFGYGLSYSRFTYSDLCIMGNGDVYKVIFTITNDSDTDGAEVAQVYVRELDREVYRPDKELKGFKKVFVKAHCSVSVEIDLDRFAFAYYSVALDDWKVHRGKFAIEICSDVETVKLTKIIEI